jgi:multidrug resistance efflux pump
MNIMKIKEALKNNIKKVENTEETVKDSSESVLQRKAGKLLAGFFAMMFLLTILSKAADSVTVAQVTTGKSSRGTLTFEAEGTGTITAESVQYSRLPAGMDINKVHVKPGQKVKKGDILLTLDMAGVEKSLKAAEREVKKQMIAIKKEGLSASPEALPTKEQAEFDYKNAKEDLIKAGKEYTEAKNDYKTATNDHKRSETTYHTALTGDKEKIRSGKEDDYKAAKDSYDTVVLTNEVALRAADRTIAKAQNALDQLKSTDSDIMQALNQYNNYRNNDWYKSQEALEDLYRMAYENANAGESYDIHKDEVDSLETKLSSANRKLREEQKAYDEAVTAKKDLSAYKQAVTAAQNEVDSITDSLDSSKVRENRIQSAADLYVMGSSSETRDKAYTNLYKYIYGSTGDKKHKAQIVQAEEDVKEAQEDKDTVIRKNNLSLETELAKMKKIQKELDSMTAGTYNYENAAETEKQTVETAKEAAKTAKQGIKTADNSVETAKRAVETAKFKLRQSMQQDGQAAKTEENQEASIALEQDSMRLDLEDKEQTADVLRKIEKDHATIKSTVTGMVSSVTFQAGKQSTVDDNIAINMGKSGLLAIIPKEDGEYVAIGDEMELTAKGKEKKITASVESIQFTKDKDGVDQTEITAVMPKGNYIPGATLDMKITKNSDLYNCCISNAALRKDSLGYYVLVAQPKSTVLGKELIATRVPVTKLEMDASKVAVQGTLSEEDDVIESSNRDISEGDRVRIK